MVAAKRVLVVENSRLQAQIAADILSRHGYMTEIALTAEDALQKASGPECPDLILMDIDLGEGMDGTALARRIQEIKDVPLVFLTAISTREAIEKVHSITHYGYIQKGAPEHVLMSTIEMALKHHEALSLAQMYRGIFEDSLTEVYIFHPGTLKFLAVNRGARENLGYTLEELREMTPIDLKPEFDPQKFRVLLEPMLNGEQEKVVLDTTHRRKDGSNYPVEVHLQQFEHMGEKVCVAVIIDLTERRRMEEELRQREATLSAITGSARDAVVMLDGEGEVTFWNPAAEDLFGYSREEILGKELHRLVVPEEARYRAYQEAFRRFQLTGEGNAIGKPIELKAKHKDGRELQVELSLSALKLMGTWHAVGIVRDISERKRVEEELENSRKQYLGLAENAPIGILKCDREGNITYVNQKVLEILGSPGIEETKKINLLTFPQLVRYGLSKKLEECLQTNKISTHEINYESKWGKKVWVRVHVKPLVNRNTVTGAQIVIDDITEKKRLEEENRRKEERLRLMLEGIPSPAWLVSRERRILVQNKAAAALFGTKVGDYCWQGIHGGQYLPDVYREAIEKTGTPLPGTKCYFCRGDEALDTKKPVNSEVEFARGIWDTWWVPLGEDVYVHYAVDVTRYKKMEEELYRLSITDHLTGAHNRRYFIQALEQEIERSRRSGQPFSLIMVDLDHFKSINDTYGHAAGDQVLKRLVADFNERLRKTDCLARWGGEEFVILLPDTTAEGAAGLAEELRRRLSRMEIPGVGHITASFGVTGYYTGDTVDTITQRVDSMLYRAKEKGRNCVCTHQ
ncbi:PAS domain S-box protein [Moorella naiadis]|uniref:PAS domain S-box protein n=1 Tax=Moorella naiadis (nom. illeg.) TaxID=3093670 RepID=UPI003D9C8021